MGCIVRITIIGFPLFGPRKSTVSRVAKEVVELVNEKMDLLIAWPEENGIRIAKGFEDIGDLRMPNVAGAVDGTLIKIVTPTEDEHQYVDRHNNHSLNVMAVCDAKMYFLFASAGFPGGVDRVF